MDELDNLLSVLKTEVDGGNARNSANFNDSSVQPTVFHRGQRKSIVSLKPELITSRGGLPSQSNANSNRWTCELMVEDGTPTGDEPLKAHEESRVKIDHVLTDDETMTTLLSAFSEKRNVLEDGIDALQIKTRHGIIDKSSGATSSQQRSAALPHKLQSPFAVKKTVNEILDHYTDSCNSQSSEDVTKSNSSIVVPQNQSCANLATSIEVDPRSSKSSTLVKAKTNSKEDRYVGTFEAAHAQYESPTTPINTSFGSAKCAKCHELITDRIVMALSQNWHVEHFQCDECLLPIGNLTFFERDEKVLCIECFEAKHMYRCAFCKECIRGPYITAFKSTFHPEHFFCGQCGKNFPPGEQFFEKEGHPYCHACYGSLFALKCAKCDTAIVGEFFTTQQKHYHKHCFTCQTCNATFPDGAYYIYNGSPYCESHYYEVRDMLCNGCRKPVMGRCILLNSTTRYHFDCFKCSTCSKDLKADAGGAGSSRGVGAQNSANGSYVNKLLLKGNEEVATAFKEIDNKPYCLDCYTSRI